MLVACWDCQPEKTNTPSPFCLWHDRQCSNEKSADRSRTLASWSPSFYGKVGNGCSNPPEFARLFVSGLPSLGNHLLVVRVGAPSDNELRIDGASGNKRHESPRHW